MGDLVREEPGEVAETPAPHDDDVGLDRLSGVADRMCGRAQLHRGPDLRDAEPPGLLCRALDDLASRRLEDGARLGIEPFEFGIGPQCQGAYDTTLSTVRAASYFTARSAANARARSAWLDPSTATRM